MYIAMNRFEVARGSEAAFETVWRTRPRHLDEVDGFVEFHLLRGPETDSHTLYSSHTLWRSHEDFVAWTHSDAFRKAHRSAGDHGPLYIGHPKFEGFHVLDGI